MNICPPAMNIAGGFSIDKVKYVCYNDLIPTLHWAMDKDLERRLHRENEKYPYAETLDELIENLKDILGRLE